MNDNSNLPTYSFSSQETHTILDHIKHLEQQQQSSTSIVRFSQYPKLFQIFGLSVICLFLIQNNVFLHK